MTVCVRHTHSLAEAGQEMGRDSTLITWGLSKHQIVWPAVSFFDSVHSFIWWMDNNPYRHSHPTHC